LSNLVTPIQRILPITHNSTLKLSAHLRGMPMERSHGMKANPRLKFRPCKRCRRPLPPYCSQAKRYCRECNRRFKNEAARRTREKKPLNEESAVKRPARKAAESRAVIRLCSWCGFPLPGRSRDTRHRECREECVAQKKIDNHLRVQEEPLCIRGLGA